MRDWRKIEKRAIFADKDEDGNRFLTSFLKDYRTIFNPQEINAGCERCLNEYYHKFIKYLNTMGTKKNPSGYVLKKKYEGITLRFGSGIIVTNATMTDKIGEELLKNHPRGKQLFDKVPAAKPKPDSKLTKKELIEKYPDIDPKLNVKDFLKAVKEAAQSK